MNESNFKTAGNERFFVYIGLVLGIAAVALVTLRVGYLAGGIVAAVPFVLYAILFSIKNPYWAFTSVFILNYFVMAIIRYFPSVPGGVVMDALLMFNLFILLLRSCYRKVGWGRARNGLTLAALVWLIYCSLLLFNPQSGVAVAWAMSIRSYAIYFFIIAVLTPIIFYRFQDLKRILYIWSVLTLIAVVKSYIQRNYGFDGRETEWLFAEGGAVTHIIYSGVRYFSIFSDAANFGSGMGFSMVVFSLSALYFDKKRIKIYFLLVAAAALYGMMISGTRSALAVPFAGYALFVLMARQGKIVTVGLILIIGSYFFLNHTSIGQGNALIRRARSAFNFDDASFQVRLENQKLMRTYMKDRPFGIGLGMGGGKAKVHAPDAYMSQIPTDSWFVLVWVETGVVGLILHLAILIYILGKGVWLVMFRLQDRQLKGLIGAMTAGIFGIMVTSYGNEIFGQFPTGIIVYICMAFIFLSPSFDREIAEIRKKNSEPENEYATKS